LRGLVVVAPAQAADGEAERIPLPLPSIFPNCAPQVGFAFWRAMRTTPKGIFLEAVFPSQRARTRYPSPGSPVTSTPEIGKYLDAEEQALAQSLETSGAPLKSVLNPRRKREIEFMARAAMTDERAKISLRVPKRPNAPEVARAPGGDTLPDVDQ
jgi:hypothetical protein